MGKKGKDNQYQQMPQLGDLPGFEGNEQAALPTTEKPEKSRTYEQEARDAGIVVTYRGIQRSTQERAKKMAQRELTPVGELVDYLLARAMDEVESGRWELPTYPRPERRTFRMG